MALRLLPGGWLLAAAAGFVLAGVLPEVKSQVNNRIKLAQKSGGKSPRRPTPPEGLRGQGTNPAPVCVCVGGRSLEEG